MDTDVILSAYSEMLNEAEETKQTEDEEDNQKDSGEDQELLTDEQLRKLTII